MFEFGQEFSFIQIGAFDGITADPLHKYITKYGWRGVLIEPQPRAAAQLCELYRDNDRIVVLQAALDCRFGKRALFTVESDNVPAVGSRYGILPAR
jgi:FkbM family methyltransferase